ncbi:Transcription initiation factor TFIID subunit 12 [Sarcoptes scabiei]|uniref:Transcription initiation factor TFIID subunit 12 n=1 Tax=Sarcoptes scabiei TaxID=52283 RepID=A0A132A019_SARSC|nr:Transcription initiation factor TFIID subunit 12 [Sarcoptes scabiei]KPM04283.1 Transcription initiation factor TFIID subunit 12-like protein [Sarcoptes scabiei]UXI16397.1 neuronal acetylcholine receptor subunit alpha-7-like [Sarcoptes scabiei]
MAENEKTQNPNDNMHSGAEYHQKVLNTSKSSTPIASLDRQRLQELVSEVDPNEQLEGDVEDVLLSLADDFIETLVSQACMLAKHRKSDQLDVKDVLFALEFNWNMWIPGFGVNGAVSVYNNLGPSHQGSTTVNNPSIMNRAPKKCLQTESHKQRLALIKKYLKKF